MGIVIDSGITVGNGITIDGSIVGQDLTVFLDANNYSGSGSTWTDQSGNGYNATLYNTPTYSSSNGGYFTFNGSNQYATVSGSPLTLTSYTKSVWFYRNLTTDNNLVSFSDPGGHYMFFNGTAKLYSGHTAWTGFPTTYASTSNFTNFVWYNVTLTFNTTDGMALYRNGALDSTYTAQKTAPTAGGVNIACYATGGNLLNGRIAQVLIYSRSLTPAEINQNFQFTRSRFGV